MLCDLELNLCSTIILKNVVIALTLAFNVSMKYVNCLNSFITTQIVFFSFFFIK